MVRRHPPLPLPTAYLRPPTAFCTRAHRRLDISAHVKVAFDLNAQRIAGFHKVFENHVDYMLVKNLHVAKRIDVELQTLQFDAAFVRNVLKANGRKVGKVRERADAGELRHLELDLDFAAGKLVRKSVERIELHLCARRRANIETLLIWFRQVWLRADMPLIDPTILATTAETARRGRCLIRKVA